MTRGQQPGRNDPCPCGSGKKYKKCHIGSNSGPHLNATESSDLMGIASDRLPSWLMSALKDGRGPLNSRPFNLQPGRQGLLTAYTDESGNTGLDLFSEGQPWFLTGTLLTVSDLEGEHENLRVALAKHGLDELHGCEVGIKGLEPLAAFVQEIIVRHDCRFIFTAAEKRHFGKMKVVQTLLDSGNNKAVSAVHAAVRPLQVRLAADIECALNVPGILEEFWPAYLKNDEKRFQASLQKLRNVMENNPDARARQLLLDALDWGIAHPLELMDSAVSAFNTPNIVALCQIVHSIHLLVDGHDVRIERFIHDRQSQFAPAIKQMYSTVTKLKTIEDEDFIFPDTVPSKTFAEKIEISEKPLVGLQLIDVALWLVKRVMDGKPPQGQCKALFHEIIKRGMFREMSAEQFYRDAEATIARIMSLPMTDETLELGRARLKEMEQRRTERMREP